VLVCVSLFGAPACSSPQHLGFGFAVRVESDPGSPLAGARIAAFGRELGVSDARGALTTELRGLSGEVLELSVVCPDGYRSPSKGLTVRLRAPAEREKWPEYSVLCPPRQRRLVLAVRAQGGANLPVRVLGEEVSRTDTDGVAHVLLVVSPGETIVVKLDTSAWPHASLMPRDPELKVIVPDHDQVVLFDQPFSHPAPPARTRKRREPVGPRPI
jgi:hypothetical protein